MSFWCLFCEAKFAAVDAFETDVDVYVIEVLFDCNAWRPSERQPALRPRHGRGLSAAVRRESEEIAPGVVFDYAEDGRVVGMEFLEARAHLPADALIAGE